MAEISVDIARDHALLQLALMKRRQTVAAYAPLSASLGASLLFHDPFQNDGDDPISHIFEVVDADECLALIAIPASTLIGVSTLFVQFGRTPRLTILLSQCDAIIARVFPQATRRALVIYAFPSVGVAAFNEETLLGVVDLLTSGVVRVDTHDGSGEMDGQTLWSYWDEFPQAGYQDLWNRIDLFVGRLLRRGERETRHVDRVVRRDNRFNTDTQEVGLLLARDAEREVARRQPVVTTSLLPVPIIGQERPYYCASASLQMIMQYVNGAAESQESIAARMNTSIQGASLDSQVDAFRNLLGSKFDIEVDRTPEFAEIGETTSSFLPAKSGIRGHARVAIGTVLEQFVDPLSGTVEFENRMLIVNDPKPDGIGCLRYESVGAVPLRDFILLRRRNS